MTEALKEDNNDTLIITVSQIEEKNYHDHPKNGTDQSVCDHPHEGVTDQYITQLSNEAAEGPIKISENRLRKMS